jgi:hypothetical protein
MVVDIYGKHLESAWTEVQDLIGRSEDARNKFNETENLFNAHLNWQNRTFPHMTKNVLVEYMGREYQLTRWLDRYHFGPVLSDEYDNFVFVKAESARDIIVKSRGLQVEIDPTTPPGESGKYESKVEFYGLECSDCFVAPYVFFPLTRSISTSNQGVYYLVCSEPCKKCKKTQGRPRVFSYYCDIAYPLTLDYLGEYTLRYLANLCQNASPSLKNFMADFCFDLADKPLPLLHNLLSEIKEDNQYLGQMKEAVNHWLADANQYLKTINGGK